MMQNVIKFNVSEREINSELRKRCLIRNPIKPDFQQNHSKEITNDHKAKSFFERHLNSTLTPSSKSINGNKQTQEMTSSNYWYTTANATIPTTKSTRTTSPKIIKRSLSESSAEEYHRFNETASQDSSNKRKMWWHNELLINGDSENSQPMRRQRNKNNDECGNTKRNINKSHKISDMIDVGIRIGLVLLFIKLETTSAFHRNIHIEELWLYKNPRTPDFVTPTTLILSVIISPFIVTILQYIVTRDRRDFRAANWVWTLCLGLNGLITSLLKLSSGRPRPDFFYRCFPDGEMVANVTPTAVNFNCTGLWRDINEGYKSFPSGHSSFAFTSFGFIAIYIAGKLHVFNNVGRGETWRLFASIWPLLIATIIAVSRTCDYHHHWQDVLVGGIIGLFVAYLTYRQYYPSIFALNSHRPFPRDGRYSHYHHTYSSSYKNYAYFDESHVIRKDERLVDEDHMPLICDQDAVEELNND